MKTGHWQSSQGGRRFRNHWQSGGGNSPVPPDPSQVPVWLKDFWVQGVMGGLLINFETGKVKLQGADYYLKPTLPAVFADREYIPVFISDCKSKLPTFNGSPLVLGDPTGIPDWLRYGKFTMTCKTADPNLIAGGLTEWPSAEYGVFYTTRDEITKHLGTRWGLTTVEFPISIKFDVRDYDGYGLFKQTCNDWYVRAYNNRAGTYHACKCNVTETDKYRILNDQVQLRIVECKLDLLPVEGGVDISNLSFDHRACYFPFGFNGWRSMEAADLQSTIRYRCFGALPYGYSYGENMIYEPSKFDTGSEGNFYGGGIARMYTWVSDMFGEIPAETDWFINTVTQGSFLSGGTGMLPAWSCSMKSEGWPK